MIAIFGPLFKEVEKPYISLSALIGYLRKNNIEVKGIDANIEFYRFIFSDKGLRYLKNQVDKKYNELEQKSNLSKIDDIVYSAILWFALSDLEELLHKNKIVNEIISTEKFYNRKNYTLAVSFIQSIIRIVEVLVDTQSMTTIPNTSISVVTKMINTKDVDVYRIFFEENIIPKIMERKESYVNILIDFISQFVPSLILAKMIKDKLPKIKITFSGDLCPNLTDTGKVFPEMFQYIDGIITYDYEETIKDIYNGIENEKLDNFVYLENGTIIETPNVARSNICTWGCPDYSEIDFKNYFAPEVELTVYTSYGCYWRKCAFCNIYRRCIKYHQKNVKMVVDEIKELQAKYDTKVINFGDEEINARRLYELAKELLEQNVKIKWSLQSRLDTELSEEEYRTIYNSGCVYIGYGFESGNKEMLERMNTGLSIDQTERILKKTHESGIMTNISVVVGFIGEDEAQWEDTIRAIEKNKENIDSILPLCYCMSKKSFVDQNRTKYGVDKVYDELNKDSLLYYYPNYIDVKPDWKEREERLQSFYSNPNLSKQLMRERFPRAIYVSHGETDISEQDQKKYSLQNLSFDILGITSHFKYNYSGDWGFKEEFNVERGEYYYITDLLNNSWVPVSLKDYFIILNVINQGELEDLANQLGESMNKAIISRLLCMKKYEKYLKDLSNYN